VWLHGFAKTGSGRDCTAQQTARLRPAGTVPTQTDTAPSNQMLQEPQNRCWDSPEEQRLGLAFLPTLGHAYWKGTSGRTG